MLYQNSVINEIQSIVQNPSTRLDDVLSIDYIPKAVLTKYPPLIKYLQKNSKTLLKLALSEEESKVSIISYSILLSNNPDILGAMFDNYYYRDLVSSLLSNATTSDVVIGRIASITLSCFIAFPEVAFENFGFIYRLLQHCDNSAVFNLFQTICSAEPRFTNAHVWLDQIGLSEYILREFNSADYSYVPTDPNFLKDKKFVNLFCLYKLSSTCSENSTLRSSFETESFVLVLAKEPTFSPTLLLNSKWKTVNALTSSVTSQFMYQHLYEKAINIIIEPFEHLCEYHVSIIEFISKMMRLYPQTLETIKQKSILQIIISIFLKFRDSTLLHDSIIDFIKTGLEDNEFSVQITLNLLQLMIDYANDRTNRIFSCFCFRVIDTFIEKAKSSKEIKEILNETPEYTNFVRNSLAPRKKLMETPYGVEPVGGKFLETLKSLF
ncbi:hypothetical protein GPJ56_002027 [Histomonas meleagridis]|uniref:uncharacterized protein n=1 Tax=Histomonas meleagridis TaxID=135588 RepID=UPI00355A8A3E|nr:hypothetical protein GPJ56_002027 [Histomonas meleagridis]KAH0800896.1 hypothetical protein GO595_006212 [Histomonas meleagridis]